MRELQGTVEHILRSWWRLWHVGFCKLLAPLQTAWIAFSQPIPASCGQLLTQLILCGSLAVTVTGLTHHWLVSSLHCSLGSSVMMAAACGLLVFLGLGLVPPVRCLFAISVPTLCTEQGRRLLLSCSTATLAVAVVPNVLANMGAIGQVLKCITEGSLESLLNTTHQLHMAARALHPAGYTGSQGLTLQAQGNGSAFQLHVFKVTQQVLEDFSDLESLAQTAVLGIQRVVTGLFVMGFLGNSAWYLYHYLTDLRFDNIYATRQLTQQLASARATHLLASPPAWLLRATRPRLSQRELLSCLIKLGVPSLLLLVTLVTVATDHMTFLLAQAAVDWTEKLPTVPITLMVKYDAAYTVLGFVPFLFNQPPPESTVFSKNKSFQWELSFTSPHCRLLPAQNPNLTAPLTAGFLQLLACCTILLEAYSRRLQHTIAASFFKNQEARRVQHLHDLLQTRYNRHRQRCCELHSALGAQAGQQAPSINRQANCSLDTDEQKAVGQRGERNLELHGPES